MAREKFLIDTDVFVEFLRTGKKYRDFFYSENRRVCISNVTINELFKKKGLRKKECNEIKTLLNLCKIINPDTHILTYFAWLEGLFAKNNLAKEKADRLIAATALAKNLPLATLNRKHFSFIKGLKLVHLG